MGSYQQLPIDAVPDITNVQVQINTEALGYSPLEVEQRITYVVEKSLAGIAQLSYSRSLSRYGLSHVTAVFEEGTDIYLARVLINEKLSSINSKLPIGIVSEMGPIATGLGEIFMYTIEAEPNVRQSNGLPYDLTALREVQDWIIKPQLALVAGVTEIDTTGGFAKQYVVAPNPQKMLAHNLSLEYIVAALAPNQVVAEVKTSIAKTIKLPTGYWLDCAVVTRYALVDICWGGIYRIVRCCRAKWIVDVVVY